MIQQEILRHVLTALSLPPTAEQKVAAETFAGFLSDTSANAVMVMRGSAGTGKTSLAAAVVKAMMALHQKVMLLAPTGRAAKVLALRSSHEAFTIHRKIYRQKAFTGDMTGFLLNDNLYTDTLFVVDEASMISNLGLNDTNFGSGRLLDDLVRFVYGGRNCRLLLVGDKAQLPPVGEEESPALMPEMLAAYGLETYVSDLNEVIRQSSRSGILYNATIVRNMITHDEVTSLPQIQFGGFADICMVPGAELIESLAGSYSHVGMDETIVVTRSNKRANAYNVGIRGSVLGREEELVTGDILMVVRNNYYWAEKEKSPFGFIANGDRARVRKVRNFRQLYGFRFADVVMSFPDYDDFEMMTTVILDSISVDAPSLTRQQCDALFNGVMEDYFDVPTKQGKLEKVRVDAYYNALQVKYAYAVTCHKAQGGQWQHVYVDQGYMTDDMLTPDYIHWLYTAFTRATEKLFLVNWPEKQTIK